jgi:hypothetical protein
MERSRLDLCGFASKRTPDRNLSSIPDWICLEKEPEVLTGLELLAKHGYNPGVWWYIFKKDILERHNISFEPDTCAEDGPFTTKLLICTERAVVLPVLLYYYYENIDSAAMTADKTRRRKFTDGMFFNVKEFGYLLELAKDKGAGAAALRRLKIKQESYVFFSVVREIRLGTPFEKIKERLLTIQKEFSAWPLRFFAREEYCEPQFKFLTWVINRLFLLRMACAVYNIFRKIRD